MTVKSTQDVLDVIESFDAVGGASKGLVAWELMVETAEVTPAWDMLSQQGLITQRGTDPTNGEAMFHLTAEGWRAWDASVRARNGSA